MIEVFLIYTFATVVFFVLVWVYENLRDRFFFPKDKYLYDDTIPANEDFKDNETEEEEGEDYSSCSSDDDTSSNNETWSSHASSHRNNESHRSSTSFSTDDVYAEENYSYKPKNECDQWEREKWLDELDRDGDDKSFW